MAAKKKTTKKRIDLSNRPMRKKAKKAPAQKKAARKPSQSALDNSLRKSPECADLFAEVENAYGEYTQAKNVLDAMRSKDWHVQHDPDALREAKRDAEEERRLFRHGVRVSIEEAKQKKCASTVMRALKKFEAISAKLRDPGEPR